MKRALGGRDALGGCGSDDRSGCRYEFTQPSRGAADSAAMKRFAHGAHSRSSAPKAARLLGVAAGRYHLGVAGLACGAGR